MKNFNDDEDEFNDEFGDDFYGRWEEFNRRMNDRQFRRNTNKFQKDIEELMRLIANSRQGGMPFNFNFIPLNSENRNDLGIPDDEMKSENGKDENGDWETKNWTSPDGSVSFTSFTRPSNPGQDLPDDVAEEWESKLRDRKNKRMNPEESKKLKLVKLQRTLDYLVENENYEKAAEIKKMMDELNSEKK